MTILELKTLLEEKLTGYQFSVPPKIELGILTTNEAFKRAKNNAISPVEASLEIKTLIEAELKHITDRNWFTVSTKGPYVNIAVTQDYLNEYIQASSIEAQIPTLPTTNRTVSLDMYQLNAAKQPHIGHIRGGNIGEALRRILLLKHKTVLSDRHLGDWGIQFGLVVWGINNQETYNLTRIDWDNPDQLTKLQQLESLYVEVNKLTNDDETIRKEAQVLCHQLEQNLLESSPNVELWEKIVTTSLPSIEHASWLLNLNKFGFWTDINTERKESRNNWSDATQELLSNKKGIWELNQISKEYHHDIDLAESFLYGYFVQEIPKWAQAGIVQSEPGETGKTKYFIDLDEEGLGRVHLMSSDGYTTYMFRDVITRFVAAGLLEVDLPLFCVDNRQSHSLKQSFAVIARLIQSGFYKHNLFPLMNEEQTATARTNLENDPMIHIANGYLILTTGAMSSRKGNVLHFKTLLESLYASVRNSLEDKDYGDITQDKIHAIAIAALKWADLSKDRESDVTFDVDTITKFEGNTGVYQLYTFARLHNILKKSDASTDSQETLISTLNESEIAIINQTLLLPFVIETITQSYKPHILCNYIYELTTSINSWYAHNNVHNEPDPVRKATLLLFTEKLANHLKICIELLGIDTLEEM
jgi:arginyl-tRNA synthetase